MPDPSPRSSLLPVRVPGAGSLALRRLLATGPTGGPAVRQRQAAAARAAGLNDAVRGTLTWYPGMGTLPFLGGGPPNGR